MKALETFKAVCEFLEGAREEPPPAFKRLASPWVQGLWWGLLAGAILLLFVNGDEE